MLDKLRSAFFRRLLRQTLAAQNRQRKTHTLQSAQSVGVLFDATEEKDRTDVLQFAKRLKEEQKKKVRLLGFVDVKQPLGQTLFPQITQKELRWNGKPFGAATETFLSEKYDLLLCLNPTQAPVLQWIAAAAMAATKIGTAVADTLHDFDIVLETPVEKGVPFFMDQLDHYLDKIVPTKHESKSTS